MGKKGQCFRTGSKEVIDFRIKAGCFWVVRGGGMAQLCVTAHAGEALIDLFIMGNQIGNAAAFFTRLKGCFEGCNILIYGWP
jgi:hypothetical protein